MTEASCEGCGHALSWHFRDVTGVVRCTVVHSGVSDRGVIGLPWSQRCGCTNYSLPKQPRPEQPELPEAFKQIIREAVQEAKGEAMGTFRVEVQAVGNHGCDRNMKDGEVVKGCGQPNCVDCITRDYIGKLRTAGVAHFDGADANSYARITHWPGQPSQVVDDLIGGVRRGNF